MSTAGRKLLSSLVHTGDLQAYIKMGLQPYLFKETEGDLFFLIRSHISKYGKIPKQSTIEEVPGFEDSIVDAPEPPKFYLDELERRHLHNTLKSTVQEASMLLTTKHAEAALDVLLKATGIVMARQRRNSLYDFREAESIIHQAYVAQKTMGNEMGLPYGWEYLDEMSGGARAGDFVTFVGRPQAGKAQPLTSKVLTPSGWVRMGDLNVGDKLASVDGADSVVTEIFPQGIKPVFRVTFRDGRATEAADEHLWEVHYRDWAKPRLLTTVQLAAKLEAKRYQNRLAVRRFGGDYGCDFGTLFSPYLLGLLIGDGCFRGPAPMLSTADPEIIGRVREELSLQGLHLNPIGGCDFRISGKDNKRNSLKEWLKDFGLWGKLSQDKFIPSWVFRASKSIRQEFFQGLMDSDGTAGKRGDITFSTSSPVLSKDMQRLVWSLGGESTIAIKATKSLPSYTVRVIFADRSKVFWLPRKACRVSQPRESGFNNLLTIKSVELIKPQECQCITVSHPTHLYVTDDYVVTHNTFKMLYTAHHAWKAGRVPLFASLEMMALIITQRLVALHSKKKLTDLMKAELSTKAFNAMMNDLHALQHKPNPLWVVDGNMANTVDDLVMFCHQLNPSALYVDGAYLLDHPDKKMGKWDKQAENARLLKQKVATDLGIPVIASYQLSKSSAKDKKKSKHGQADGMEDVYGSDEMAQLSSVMLGLFDNEDSIEAKKTRRVKLLKGRNGETGEFVINWDFSTKMDFSQHKTEKPEDVQMDFMG